MNYEPTRFPCYDSTVPNLVTLPGLIDCHVHFREPGYEQKGGMKSESAAAKAGGVLTVCEMPNTIPPTVSVKAFEDKVRRAKKISDVDIRFFFGATTLEHLDAFREVWDSPKCCGLKIYFDHSTGDQGANDEIIEAAFGLCAELGAPLVGHCEDAQINAEARRIILDSSKGDMMDVSLHTLMRPCAAEAAAITRAIDLVRQHGTQFHVAHLSTAQGVDLIRQAKKDGLSVTCEVTPHHLFLSTEDYPRLGTLGKMNPPLRTLGEQQALWEGINDGTVDCIATDHAPHTLGEKQSGNPLDTPSGVPGIETMLPLLLTVVAGRWPRLGSKLQIPDSRFETWNLESGISDITRLCFTNPNRIFSLGVSEEQRITVDLDAEWVIKGSKLHSRCGWTPYEGWKVWGRIKEE